MKAKKNQVYEAEFISENEAEVKPVPSTDPTKRTATVIAFWGFFWGFLTVMAMLSCKACYGVTLW